MMLALKWDLVVKAMKFLLSGGNEDPSAPGISKVLIPSNAIVTIFSDRSFVMGYPQKGILFKMPYLRRLKP